MSGTDLEVRRLVAGHEQVVFRDRLNPGDTVELKTEQKDVPGGHEDVQVVLWKGAVDPAEAEERPDDLREAVEEAKNEKAEERAKEEAEAEKAAVEAEKPKPAKRRPPTKSKRKAASTKK